MDRITKAPRWLWAIPTGIAALRCLPWLASHLLEPRANEALLHMGFIPKDTLQYLAFAREAGENASLFVANPFTVEPQAGRFLLPLTAVIGWLAAATGVPAIAWLELSRLPLLGMFFAVLWRLLAEFFETPRERALACVLIGLAGGVEVLAKPLAGALPPELRLELEQATWQMSGWNLFAASANPLWLAGGAAALALLRPLLVPRGAVPARLGLGIALGGFGLFALHPYSAVAVFAIALAQPIVALAARAPLDRARWLRLGAALLTAGLLIALLASWQRADAVFAATSAGALGSQQLSPFWYPLVLGGLCVLGLRGARIWAAGSHPLRFALLAWLLAAVLLHTSTLLNGYHFAAQLHVPLCILAAPAFFETWRAAREWRPGALALCAVTFAAPVLLTAESIVLLRATHGVPLEYPRLIEALRAKPAGNVLAGARLGNVLPAWTHHRVYVGHHFLTPRYFARQREVIELTGAGASPEALQAFVERHRIRYAVLPSERTAALEALAARTQRSETLGRFTLLELAAPR
jgi:hypothetical protein